MPPRPEQWQRINRNSLAQFMKTRLRWFHVAKQRVVMTLPHPTNPELSIDTAIWTPGNTYRKPQEATR